MGIKRQATLDKCNKGFLVILDNQAWKKTYAHESLKDALKRIEEFMEEENAVFP